MKVIKMTQKAMELYDRMFANPPEPNTEDHLQWQETLDRLFEELHDVEGEA